MTVESQQSLVRKVEKVIGVHPVVIGVIGIVVVYVIMPVENHQFKSQLESQQSLVRKVEKVITVDTVVIGRVIIVYVLMPVESHQFKSWFLLGLSCSRLVKRWSSMWTWRILKLSWLPISQRNPPCSTEVISAIYSWSKLYCTKNCFCFCSLVRKVQKEYVFLALRWLSVTTIGQIMECNCYKNCHYNWSIWSPTVCKCISCSSICLLYTWKLKNQMNYLKTF